MFIIRGGDEDDGDDDEDRRWDRTRRRIGLDWAEKDLILAETFLSTFFCWSNRLVMRMTACARQLILLRRSSSSKRRENIDDERKCRTWSEAFPFDQKRRIFHRCLECRWIAQRTNGIKRANRKRLRNTKFHVLHDASLSFSVDCSSVKRRQMFFELFFHLFLLHLLVSLYKCFDREEFILHSIVDTSFHCTEYQQQQGERERTMK